MNAAPWPTLLPKEVAELTGYKQRARQAACLTANAFPFRLAARVLIDRTVYQRRMGWDGPWPRSIGRGLARRRQYAEPQDIAASVALLATADRAGGFPMYTRLPLVLTPVELIELTGYKEAADQILWLKQYKFVYLLGAGGRPRVDRTHYLIRMGGIPAPTQRVEPDWAALESSNAKER